MFLGAPIENGCNEEVNNNIKNNIKIYSAQIP